MDPRQCNERVRRGLRFCQTLDQHSGLCKQFLHIGDARVRVPFASRFGADSAKQLRPIGHHMPLEPAKKVSLPTKIRFVGEKNFASRDGDCCRSQPPSRGAWWHTLCSEAPERKGTAYDTLRRRRDYTIGLAPRCGARGCGKLAKPNERFVLPGLNMRSTPRARSPCQYIAGPASVSDRINWCGEI